LQAAGEDFYRHGGQATYASTIVRYLVLEAVSSTNPMTGV
jgi:hypothetical protein